MTSISAPTKSLSSRIGAGDPASPTAVARTSATTPRTGWFPSLKVPLRLVSAGPLQSGRSCALRRAEQQEGLMAQATGRKAGGGLARPVQPSADLAKITGNDPLPRSQVVSKVWDHIRKNNLQNPQNKREIVADDKLKKVFGGKDRVSMFEMNKHLSNHLK